MDATTVIREYLKLGLRFDRIEEGYVDSFTGDPQLRRDVADESAPDPAELARQAHRLIGEVAAVDELDGVRRDYLAAHLRALACAGRKFAGEDVGFVDEVREYFDVDIVKGDPDAYLEAHRKLDVSLGGSGPLAERMQAYRAGEEIPPERLEECIHAFSSVLRDRVRADFPLPDSETITYEIVTDKPWSGFNYYNGDYRSTVAVNADLKQQMSNLPRLVAHESYPGHHTEHCRKEAGLVARGGQTEQTIFLVNTPQCLMAEGLADLALYAVIGPQWGAWASEIYADLGLRFDGERAQAISEASAALADVRQDAALMLHDERRDADDVVAFLQKWLLRLVGQRLQGATRDTDTVARICGDEFVVLIEGELGPPEGFADRLRTALRPPFALLGTPVQVRASMGLVMPDPSSPRVTSDELLRHADDSMYVGKRQGKDAAVLYRQTLETVDFPTALRRASGGVPTGFRLVYQPIVRLPGETPVAVEALARWTAPNGAQISPETFVAAAEAAGLGFDFDAMVLDVACRQVAASGQDLSVHVNVGAGRLGDRLFERRVADVLLRHGLEPGRLILEITESVPIVDLAEGAAAIRRLRATGVKVGLDDFGAGYNSLTYLHALPVDLIKLDRALTIGLHPDHDASLYRSVIGICDELGFAVVAEGIETEGQSQLVQGAGCVLAQGYLFGRPVPISQLARMTAGAATGSS